jgi:hypothetical protein
MPFFAGLDWGGARHALCVIDTAGAVVLRFEAEHGAAGLAAMLARLRAVAPPADLPLATERPSGLAVDTLVAAGHPVVPVHPNVVRACRPRCRAAAAKSDAADACMLADILRTAVTCFADNSRHASAWAAAIDRRARNRGCRHPHAIRILARAWVRVLWKAWRNRTAHDPAKHRAASQIAA